MTSEERSPIGAKLGANSVPPQPSGSPSRFHSILAILGTPDLRTALVLYIILAHSLAVGCVLLWCSLHALGWVSPPSERVYIVGGSVLSGLTGLLALCARGLLGPNASKSPRAKRPRTEAS